MALPMSKRKKKHKNPDSNPPASPAEPKPEAQTEWFGLVLGLLVTFALSIIIINNDSKTVVISAWLAMAVAVGLVLYKLWKAVSWAVWEKVVAVSVTMIVFGYFASTSIRDRLRPSYVFVAPGVWLNNDTWYLLVNHRGPKTSSNVQILFQDADRGEYLRRTQQSLSADDLNSEQFLVNFPEINPLGRGSIFAQHFLWKPFSPQHSHFSATVTWRDGGVNEEIEIVKIQGKWAYAMKVSDRETGKELIHCRDKDFPSNEVLPACFPDVSQPNI